MIQKFHEKLKNCSIEKLEIGLLWAKLILFFCWSYGFSSSCLDFRKLSFFFNFWNAYLDRIPILSSFGLYFLNPKQNIFFLLWFNIPPELVFGSVFLDVILHFLWKFWWLMNWWWFCRSRVQQITGAPSSPLWRSGSMLPPPADDYCNNSSASAAKPVVKNASDVRFFSANRFYYFFFLKYTLKWYLTPFMHFRRVSN